MKKKIIIISIIVIFIIISLVGYFTFNTIYKDLSDNIKLDTDNYLTSVEVKSNANFILLINKKEKVSNIIFLDENSVKSLYKKKIEGNSIEEAIRLIVDNLKSNNIIDTNSNFQLIDYGNSNIFSKVKEEFNKEFVIYGIEKDISSGTTTIKDKMLELGQDDRNNEKDNLSSLYDYSLNNISNYMNNDTSVSIKEEDIDKYATNVYNKLVGYSANITSQDVNSKDGIDITTINATSDYTNELYALKDSWYYIENGKVFAYIKFNYKNKNYDYCFKGNESYINSNCQ